MCKVVEPHVLNHASSTFNTTCRNTKNSLLFPSHVQKKRKKKKNSPPYFRELDSSVSLSVSCLWNSRGSVWITESEREMVQLGCHEDHLVTLFQLRPWSVLILRQSTVNSGGNFLKKKESGRKLCSLWHMNLPQASGVMYVWIATSWMCSNNDDPRLWRLVFYRKQPRFWGFELSILWGPMSHIKPTTPPFCLFHYRELSSTWSWVIIITHSGFYHRGSDA